MNREIKFRVWNGRDMEYNIMAGIFGVFYINPNADGKGLDSKDTACLNPFNTIYSKESPIMQFTGLKDKNGKEIYECDIVKIKYNEDLIFNYTVKFGKYRDKLDYYQLGYFLDELDYYANVELINENCEIIGNIFENPELLK